jgi:hypothetical protein
MSFLLDFLLALHLIHEYPSYVSPFIDTRTPHLIFLQSLNDGFIRNFRSTNFYHKMRIV